MTRTIPSGIATDLAAGRTTLARCLRLDLRDGTAIGVTDHDHDLSVNLGDGALTYSHATGALPSAVALSLGFEADSFELRGPLNAIVTRAAVLGGRYDRALARLFDVDWTATTDIVPLLRGRVTEARVEGGAFVMSVRSAADAFNQTIGAVLTPYCRYDLGDARCTVDLGPFTFAGEVASVTDELTFTVTWDAATPSADQARMGKLSFLTGDLAGCPPIEVFSLAAGAMTLWAPAAAPPAIGDAFEMIAGCDKLRATCRDTFANAVNFGGEPDLTGSEAYNRYAVPGSSG